MKNRRLVLFVAVTAAVLFFVPRCLMAEPAAEKNIEILKAADAIYVLVSPKGGNVTVSTGEDGLFLIDDQLTERSEIIQEAVKEISGEPIQFILNTHYHFDHTGGNEFFGSKDAVIIAQDNVRKRLSVKQFITAFKKEMPSLSKEGLPVVTFSESMNLHYNGDDIRILHLPAAHTDGDTVAYFTKANVLVGGDLIFNGFYPFIDIEHGGSVKGVIAGIERMLSLIDSNTAVIPGHGAIMNKEKLLAYKEMLVSISGSIEMAVKENKTLEQVIAEKPTQAFDAKMKEGPVSPDTFVTIVYQGLKGQ